MTRMGPARVKSDGKEDRAIHVSGWPRARSWARRCCEADYLGHRVGDFHWRSPQKKKRGAAMLLPVGRAVSGLRFKALHFYIVRGCGL